MHHHKFYICVILCLSLVTQVFGQEDWKLEKSEDNINVYTRKVDGRGIKDLKIECKIKSSLNSIVAILDDIEAHPEWVYRCENSSFVENNDPTEFYYYIGVNFPAPARDRDMVIYYKREQEPDTKIIKTYSYAAPDKIGPVDGKIRITDFESTYTLIPHQDGTVDITYYLRSDPAGYIPTWMINLAITKGPITTMKSMFKEIWEDKYQSAQMVGVEELR